MAQTLTPPKTNGFKLADGIKNMFSSDKENDKSSEQYVLNPTELQPEQETFEESIDRQKQEIDRLENSRCRSRKIQTKKIAKIRKTRQREIRNG